MEENSTTKKKKPEIPEKIKPFVKPITLGVLRSLAANTVKQLLSSKEEHVFESMKSVFLAVFTPLENEKIRCFLFYESLSLYDIILKKTFQFDEEEKIDWKDYPIGPKSLTFGHMEILESKGFSFFSQLSEDTLDVLAKMDLVFETVYTDEERKQIDAYPVIIAMRLFGAVRDCTFGGEEDLKN